MFDPIEITRKIKKIVCEGEKRKYYRIRPARFYGGIATADVVGCNLSCIFCWAWNVVHNPKKYGKFYSPKEIAKRLVSIAKKYSFENMRVSGNEPTLGDEHLIKLLENLKNMKKTFILETNGILIGYDKKFAKRLSEFENLHVRVSLKGANKEEFSKLTGAKPEAFNYQLRALENLSKYNVSCHPAVMVSFSSEKNLEDLRNKLKNIREDFANFEIEELVFYGNVKSRLEKAGIIPRSRGSSFQF